ncbi:MAG TPA: winged helix-turn-helix domain-containing protein, partial [Pyrinomonadaceae bacterium]|nr:winged helix-turn-helix domain-containing protein [Pyrinomonadaceae bacterium]
MPHSQDTCYEFGTFRLDVNQRVLTRAGEPISLTPKATDILLLLLDNAGQLVDKEELIREVWPDSFVEEQNLTQNIFVLRRALGDGVGATKYIETVPRRGYRFVAPVKKISGGQAAATSVSSSETEVALPPILAVLPFINATGDPKLEYLAEGITENIINNLSRISKLRVISRSAVFRYRGREVDPLLIGQGLGVDVVLSGNMYPRVTGFTIRAELVDVKHNWQLWGENFECEMSQILEIQDELTRQISAALRLRLTGEEEKQLTTRHTENSKAYQAYLEGRYHWSKYTKEGIEKAIVHFREAIDLDPKYALAYSGIIDCYLRLATNYLPPEGDASVAKTSICDLGRESTLEIENSEAKVKLRREWDWRGASIELRRANDLKTDYPAAHQWYAAYVFAKGIYQQSRKNQTSEGDRPLANAQDLVSLQRLPKEIPSIALTTTEQIQIYCAIAREQIAVGNCDG